MNIYLDVDGVLVSGGEPAQSLDEFIAYIDNNYRDRIYWLTTHCQGSTSGVLSYLKRFVDDADTLIAMERIKPTKWNTAKTDGIDFTQPFIWFDDNLFYAEKEALMKNKVVDSVVLVNLKDNPDSLKMFVSDFPIAV